MAPEALARALGQWKEIQGVQSGEEAVKPPLFADDVVLYINGSKKSIKNN